MHERLVEHDAAAMSQAGKQAVDRRTQEPDPQARRWAAPDVVGLGEGRIGTGAVSRAHAGALKQARGVRSPRLPQTVLHLQTRYGNRYLQRVVDLSKDADSDVGVAPDVESAIERKRGGGQMLDQSVRSQMESVFGVDFSGVRVHTDSEANALNHRLGARAFATGKDVFFRDGHYSPASSDGRHLLAHELTHVVQQAAAPVDLRKPGAQIRSKEDHEAERAPQTVRSAAGRSGVGVSAGHADVQAKCAACASGQGPCPKCAKEEPKIRHKLSVSQPGDQYEQEADQVADRVVQLLQSGAWREAAGARQAATGREEAACPKCQAGRSQRLLTRNSHDALVESATVFPTASQMPPMSLGSAFETVIRNEGAGRPLDPRTRELMESRFGHDFGGVRLHSDSRALHAARLIDADAFTVGEHIFLGVPQLDPTTREGRQLLAHELVHVLQQRRAGLDAGAGTAYELSDGGASEREAHRFAGQLFGDYASGEAGFGVGFHVGRAADRVAPVQVSAVRTTAQPRRRPGEGFTDCVNRFLANQGITGAITTMIWVACGVIGGIGALGGTLIEPGGGTLTGLGLALAGCLAVGTGFPIGVIISSLIYCSE